MSKQGSRKNSDETRREKRDYAYENKNMKAYYLHASIFIRAIDVIASNEEDMKKNEQSS